MLLIPREIPHVSWQIIKYGVIHNYILHIAAPVCGHSHAHRSGKRAWIEVLPRKRGARLALLNTSGCQFPFFLLFWCTQTCNVSPRLRQKPRWCCCMAVFYFILFFFYIASSCRDMLAPQRDNRRCWSHLQTPGDRDQAQETSRSNQCLLTYTDRLIYDETLKKSFIFHHL